MTNFNNDIKCYACKLPMVGVWIYNPEFIAGKNPPYYHMKCWLDLTKEKEKDNGKQPLQPKG
jgi:hypothetical protein